MQYKEQISVSREMKDLAFNYMPTWVYILLLKIGSSEFKHALNWALCFIIFAFFMFIRYSVNLISYML